MLEYALMDMDEDAVAMEEDDVYFDEVPLYSPMSAVEEEVVPPTDCWHTVLAWILFRHRDSVHSSPMPPMHKMLHIPPVWIGEEEPAVPPTVDATAVTENTAPKPQNTIACCCGTSPTNHLFISWTVIVVLGLILRILYQLAQCHAAAGFFGAVNGSTWESLKLLLWPILFWWLITAVSTFRLTRNLNGAVVSAYSAAGCMLCLVALVTEVGHTYAAWIDILLLMTSALVGQACGIFLGVLVPYNARVSVAMMVILLASLSIFTLAAIPPSPFLFADRGNSSNYTYGAPLACQPFSFDQFSRIDTLLMSNSSSTLI